MIRSTLSVSDDSIVLKTLHEVVFLFFYSSSNGEQYSMSAVNNSGAVPFCGVPISSSVTVYKEEKIRFGLIIVVLSLPRDGSRTNGPD